MISKRPEFKGAALVFLSALLFGSYGIWAVLVGSDFGIFYQGYVRAFLVLLVLIPIVFIQKSWKPLSTNDWKNYMWCIGFGVFTQAPIYYAFQHVGVGISSLILFSMMLTTSYVVGFLLLKERPTKRKIVSLALAIIGLGITFYNSLEAFSSMALLLATINGVASGGEVATTKLIPEKFSTIQTSIIVWGAIFLTHLPLSFLFGERQLIPTFNIHWFAMIGFTFAGIFAFWLVIEGFKYIDASIGGLIGLLEIIFAIIFGVVIFKEKITISIIIGSVLIISAAILPFIKKTKQ